MSLPRRAAIPQRGGVGTRPGIDMPAARQNIPLVSNEAQRQQFKSFLAQKGLRVTNQRLAILEAAFGQQEHFTAEQLLDQARRIDDSVSRATVYRTLPIMTESAILREIDIGTGKNSTGTPRTTRARWPRWFASIAIASSRSAPLSWIGTAAPSRRSWA